MSDWPPLSDADRQAYHATRMRELFDEWQPLTPKEYIGIELCRRGFSRTGSFERPAPAPVKHPVVESSMIGPRRPGCLQRDDDGQLFFELLPPAPTPPAEEPK